MPKLPNPCEEGDPRQRAARAMPHLVSERLAGQFAESAKLESAIRKNLEGLGCAL
ncbi:MAG: hypothetical protein R3F11_24480 [Verrucomicrobiales bacterium]